MVNIRGGKVREKLQMSRCIQSSLSNIKKKTICHCAQLWKTGTSSFSSLQSWEIKDTGTAELMRPAKPNARLERKASRIKQSIHPAPSQNTQDMSTAFSDRKDNVDEARMDGGHSTPLMAIDQKQSQLVS